MLKICSSVILLVLLTACSGESDEAKKLGFASIDEMKEIHAQGWHTKNRFEGDFLKRKQKEINNVEKMLYELKYLEHLGRSERIQPFMENLLIKFKSNEIAAQDVSRAFGIASSELYKVSEDVLYFSKQSENPKIKNGFDILFQVSKAYGDIMKINSERFSNLESSYNYSSDLRRLGKIVDDHNRELFLIAYIVGISCKPDMQFSDPKNCNFNLSNF